MRTICCLLLLLSVNTAIGQCGKAAIRKREITQFMQSLHAGDSSAVRYVSVKNNLQPIEEHFSLIANDTLFSAADIHFLKLQMQVYRHFTWTSTYVQGAKMVSVRKLNRLYKHYKNWEQFHRECAESIEGYSVPLFSCDKTKVLIYQSIHCGALCGGGQLSVFQYVNGKWVFVKRYGSWIS